MTTAGPPASLLPTLPGRYYTDPAVFAAEQAAIFESLWFCAMRSADLSGPGQFRTVQVGRESVIVVRARDGRRHAFLNVCRHRGARLCTDEHGTVRRNFRCAYHSWTYGLDGRLVAAPNLADLADVDRAAYGLRAVHLREWLGFVWLCLAAEPPSFEDTVTSQVAERLGSPGAIGRYQPDQLVTGRRIRYDVAANWKLLVENFMECYHCASIHPELVAVLPEFAQGYAAQYFVGHGAEFAPEARGFTVDGRAGFGRLAQVADGQDRRYYAITVRPQMFLNLVPDHVIAHRMFPLAPDRTIVECDWLFARDVVDAGHDLSPSVELFDRVNRQDFDACERCQPSMSSRGYAEGGVLVPSEHHIGAFHDWLRGLLGEPAPM
jgi:Rieske 2Fe-2S family protein